MLHFRADERLETIRFLWEAKKKGEFDERGRRDGALDGALATHYEHALTSQRKKKLHSILGYKMKKPKYHKPTHPSSPTPY